MDGSYTCEHGLMYQLVKSLSCRSETNGNTVGQLH